MDHHQDFRYDGGLQRKGKEAQISARNKLNSLRTALVEACQALDYAVSANINEEGLIHCLREGRGLSPLTVPHGNDPDPRRKLPGVHQALQRTFADLGIVMDGDEHDNSYYCRTLRALARNASVQR